MNKLFSHASPVFPVIDMEKSIHFYTVKLGFDLSFSWGEPITYAVLKSGTIGIHLSLSESNHKDIASYSFRPCALYIFVFDVNKVYHNCLRHHVKIINVPEKRDYQMTDFDIEDPNGHIITFGKGK